MHSKEYLSVRDAMIEVVSWARAIKDIADLARLSEHLPADSAFDAALTKATRLAMDDFKGAVERWDEIVQSVVEID